MGDKKALRPPMLTSAELRHGSAEAAGAAGISLSRRQRRGWRIAFIVVSGLCALWGSLSAGAAPQEDTEEVIRRSVEVVRSNYDAAPGFDFCTTAHYANGGSRTYQQFMILGSRYSRLVAIDGEPLPADRAAKEQAALAAAVRARREENSQARRERIDKYERERQRDQAMLMAMVDAFKFTLAGEETLEGRQVYRFNATPRKGYRATNNRTKVLTGMEGTLWVDKATHQWVRVEAAVIHPVSIEGFIARVQPGTRFEMDLMPVTGSIWMPRHFAMQARTRVLFLFTNRQEEDEDYSRYSPAKDWQSISPAEEESGCLAPPGH